MSPSNDPLTNGDDSLTRGDEEAERGATAEAQKSFELALAQFRSVDGDDVRRANGKLGQADAHRRLGDLAERTRGALGEARKHYAAAVRLLAPLMPLQDGRPVSSASFECQALRRRLVYTLLQVARLDAVADQPGAEVFFRFALDLAEEARSVLWHYVGAYCQRRLLPIAAFLAHQQSIEELPSDDDDGMLMALHQQLVALNSLHAKGPDEILGMLGIVGLLERQGALSRGDSPPGPAPKLLLNSRSLRKSVSEYYRTSAVLRPWFCFAISS